MTEEQIKEIELTGTKSRILNQYHALISDALSADQHYFMALVMMDYDPTRPDKTFYVIRTTTGFYGTYLEPDSSLTIKEVVSAHSVQHVYQAALEMAYKLESGETE